MFEPNNRKIIAIVITVLVVILVLLYIDLCITRTEQTPGNSGTKGSSIIPGTDAEDAEIIEGDNGEYASSGGSGDLFADILEQIRFQQQVDKMLLEELDSGAYSFDDPLVVVDPYGLSPLTALVLFSSEAPINVSIHVPGKTEQADVDFTFSGYNTRHIAPIIGLYPGELNNVVLTGTSLGGGAKSITLGIRTDPLPPVLAQNIILADLAQPENYQPGFNYSFAQKSAFDVNGDYRWFYNDFRANTPTLYDYNGHIILAFGSTLEGDALLLEINHLGKCFNVYYSPYGVHHEIIAIDGQNLVVAGSRGDTVEDFIYEIDVENGAITNTLDLKRILQRTRTDGFPEYDPTNWINHNATTYDNGSIVISGRRQSAIAKLSWPEGRLEWILSDHIGWNPMFRKFLLLPTGDDFEWSYGQHAALILPDFDSDPDTVDILLFDNGNGRFDHDREFISAMAEGEALLTEPYSRMVHYRINEAAMTVEQVWQFGKELGELFCSIWCSSAYLLTNGNRLGTFDRFFLEYGGSFNTSIVEVDYSGNIVWEAYATSENETGTYFAYRCLRQPLYTIEGSDPRIGAPARIFIPEEKLPKERDIEP